VADLEADVEDLGEFESWDDDVEQTNGEDSEGLQDRHVTPKASTNALADNSLANARIDLSDLEAAISNINIADSLNGIANQPVAAPATPQRSLAPAPSSSVTQPVAINIVGANEASGLSPLFQHSNNGLAADRAPDCPMTPRNDAGPFVLDGSAGRAAGQRIRDVLDERPAVSSTSSAPTLPPMRLDWRACGMHKYLEMCLITFWHILAFMGAWRKRKPRSVFTIALGQNQGTEGNVCFCARCLYTVFAVAWFGLGA